MSWWPRESTNQFQLKIRKVYSHGWGSVLNSIVYSIHARHVSIWCDCSCVVRWINNNGQEWKRRKKTRQRMESVIETSDLKLSGDLVQTSKNCDAKHERNFQLFCSRSRQALARDWKELWVRVLVEIWVPWPIELCDVSSGCVAGLLFFLPSACVNWCSCASLVIFFGTVLWSIRCLVSLSRFKSSACCTVHVAWVSFQLVSLSKFIIMDTDTLHAHSAGFESWSKQCHTLLN